MDKLVFPVVEEVNVLESEVKTFFRNLGLAEYHIDRIKTGIVQKPKINFVVDLEDTIERAYGKAVNEKIILNHMHHFTSSSRFGVVLKYKKFYHYCDIL